MPPAPDLPSEALPAGRSWPDRGASPVGLAVAGLLAYGVALVATLPARFVAPRNADAAGTVWHGVARIGPTTARWEASPAASLATASLAATWTIDGPASLLTGLAQWRPFGGTEVTGVRGRAGWGLLAAAVPGLPGDCTIPMDVALDRIAARTLRGTVRTLPGTCGTAPVRVVPRLIATFDGSSGRITPWSDRAATLAIVAITGNTVHLRVTPAGAAVLPGPGRAGDLEFEL